MCDPANDFFFGPTGIAWENDMKVYREFKDTPSLTTVVKDHFMERRVLIDKIVSIFHGAEDVMIDYSGQGDFIVTSKTGPILDKSYASEQEAMDAMFEYLAGQIADEVLR